MKYTSSILLVLCAMCGVISLPSSNTAKEYRKHIGRVFQFRCKDPQPRAIPIGSLHNPGSQQIFHPTVTVLHRCDAASGCCPQSERLICGPVKEEEVSLVFSYTNVMDDMTIGNSGRKNSGFITVTATNHTECGCLDIYDMPK